jgi:hypothetical protein
MHNPQIEENKKTLQFFRIVTFIWSIIFVAILINGYFNLFITSFGSIIAFILGTLLAFLAWGLGRHIGASGGIKNSSNSPLFILMLMISAVGVFNALMINLEGKPIFTETIDESSRKYQELSLLAKKHLKNPEVDSFIAEIESLKSSLRSEMKNIKNCGEGESARKILQLIQNKLPNFRPTSGGVRCDKVDEVLNDYNKTIDALVKESKEFNTTNYNQILNLRNKILDENKKAQDSLMHLKQELNNGASLIRVIKPELEIINQNYESLASALKQELPDGVNINSSINLSNARALGEWSQVLGLIISRLDKFSTYLYLLLAFFIDWITVYFFNRVQILRKDAGDITQNIKADSDIF